MASRITKQAARLLAESAFDREADKRLRPEHLAALRHRQAGQYDMAPQADEWVSILGFAPDQRMFHEFGFSIFDSQLGSVLVCRALVDRNEAKPKHAVVLDWYPSRADPRKRPD